jgi:hypothetical protein
MVRKFVAQGSWMRAAWGGKGGDFLEGGVRRLRRSPGSTLFRQQRRRPLLSDPVATRMLQKLIPF